MTAVKSGLMVIDQYRAHVRILYERYLSQINGKGCSSQQILFPEMIQFSPSETVIIDKISNEIANIGFDLASLGGGSYSINGIPAGLEDVDYVKLLKNIVDDFIETGIGPTEGINSALALQLAKSAAIPYGQVLDNAEMESIVNELFTCSNVNYTPDGKPVIGMLKQHDIDNLFC